jgi:hypothetical protein
LAIKHLGHHPFGFSARRIGDLYCGAVKDWGANSAWKAKYIPPQAHTHHALEDALANARALIAMNAELGLKIPGL